jgi:hypothetical protein
MGFEFAERRRILRGLGYEAYVDHVFIGRIPAVRMEEILADGAERPFYIGRYPSSSEFAESVWYFREATYAIDGEPSPEQALKLIRRHINNETAKERRRTKARSAAMRARRDAERASTKQAEAEALARANADHLRAEDARLLQEARAIEAERRRRQELAWAREVVAGSEGSATRREGIPRHVRLEVWERGQGRCTECGSTALLQFDHVIPLALGGSNSIGNLQLLCDVCNQRKSKSI